MILDFNSLDKGLDVVRIDFIAENDVKINPLATGIFFAQDHVRHSALDHGKQFFPAKPFQGFTVRLVALGSVLQVIKPAQQLFVAGNGKIVVDADDGAIRVAELNHKTGPIALEVCGGRAVYVKVPFAPLRAARM